VTASSLDTQQTALRGGSPLGLHRVAEPVRGAAQAGAPGHAGAPGEAGGVLPQAAWRLDPRREIWPDEVRVGLERLNLDAASYRQLHEAHGGDPEAIRAAVLGIVAERGKMQNPVTGSGGMLTGVVEEVGPKSALGLAPGDRVATLVSLSLTPLAITDGLVRWDGRSEQVPCAGHAILFGRSIATVLPDDLPVPLALAVLDVCGAPALTHRVVAERHDPVVAVIGAAGKSGSLSLAAAMRAGAAGLIGVVRDGQEAATLRGAGLAHRVTVADARDPVGLATAVQQAGGPADVTVVCVDVPGCEGGAVLATAQGGTVIFFSMATSFTAAALGAEGVAADVTMLIGNGYVPGHAEFALTLIRENQGVRTLFENRIAGETEGS
jgi:L-erythro-3,5-diaminohexanoate dehydrogenase